MHFGHSSIHQFESGEEQMTWTRSKGRVARWGAAGAAAAAAVAAGLGGATAASAATAATIPVRCSVTALNNAISFSPSDSILVLKPGCVYSTSSPLKTITRDLTISGSNDVIRSTGTTTILHISNATVSISQLTFTDGSSKTDAGAIHNIGGTVTLTSTTFSDNTGDEGGAILNSNGATLLINSSTFADNHASFQGGAIYNEGNSTIGISGTTFFDNTSVSNGGAIENVSGSVYTPSDAAQSTFRDNSATNAGSLGGAIRNFVGSVDVTNVQFTDNSAAGSGGAFSNVGGTSTVTNSGFTGNTAGTNGGAIQTTKSLNLVGDTISANAANQRGGGLYVSGGTTTLSQNTFVTGNFAGITGGGIYRQSGTVVITSGSFVHLNSPNNCTGLSCP